MTDATHRPRRLHCSAFRQLAENCAESLTRGCRTVVTGRLKQRSHEDREGVQRTVFEVEVEDVGPSLKWASAKVVKTSRRPGRSCAFTCWRGACCSIERPVGDEPGAGRCRLRLLVRPRGAMEQWLALSIDRRHGRRCRRAFPPVTRACPARRRRRRGIRRDLGLGEDVAAVYDSDRTRGHHRMLIRRRSEVVSDIQQDRRRRHHREVRRA
ncbi:MULTISPECIES: single-stranded DNA-binding protein [unclassified Nonomuraea]|uniref:single-stranded DNA-binding protein n=1 Tax=unclassified Nonomuraea TaxID=2593643 RepID=UPI0033FBEB3E